MLSDQCILNRFSLLIRITVIFISVYIDCLVETRNNRMLSLAIIVPDEIFIRNYLVRTILFLSNIFTALQGTRLYLFIYALKFEEVDEA